MNHFETICIAAIIMQIMKDGTPKNIRIFSTESITASVIAPRTYHVKRKVREYVKMAFVSCEFSARPCRNVTANMRAEMLESTAVIDWMKFFTLITFILNKGKRGTYN